ncbi:MAG: hypothetical protein H0T73_12910, partial [Ardenticatenales bacterium]|nr:hypothetical protein [Ardenticatenales bacterium]
ISWLTGTVASAGLQMPAQLDLPGIFSLVMQVLGLTYQNIRTQVVRGLGPQGETLVGGLEKTWDVFQIFQQEGIAGLWKYFKDMVGDLKTMVIEEIKSMVTNEVIKAGINWLMGILGGPVGAFIKAVQAIISVVTWFINNGSRLMSLVNSVIDSVSAIANGDIGGAAAHIENSLAQSVPMVISFLADLLHLGDISKKAQDIFKKVRAPIEKAVQWLIKQAKAMAKKIMGLFGGGKDKKKPGDGPDERSTEEKQKDLDQAVGKAERLLDAPDARAESVRKQLPSIKEAHGLTSLELIKTEKDSYYVHGKVNPEKKSKEKIFELGGLKLTGEEILLMIRRVATRISEDEEVKDAQKRVKASEIVSTEVNSKETTATTGVDRLGRANNLIAEGKRKPGAYEKVNTGVDAEGNPIIVSNQQSPMPWSGQAPVVKSEGGGAYSDYAAKMKKSGKSPQVLAQAIQQFIKTGKIEPAFQQESQLIAELADLMVCIEGRRTPSATVATAMCLELASSPDLDPKAKNGQPLSWQKTLERHPMTVDRAEKISDGVNTDLGYDGSNGNPDFRNKPERKKEATEAEIEQAQKTEIALAVDWVKAKMADEEIEKFKDKQSLETFVETQIRQFYGMKTKRKR